MDRSRVHLAGDGGGIPVFIVTEGSEGSALRSINHHGLLPFIAGVIETTKSADAFRTIASRHRGDAEVMFSVGDQLDRDVVFAQKAGFKTIYFPGGFTPAWLPAVSEAKPDYQIVSFDEVVELALAAGK